ncbi:MAG: pyridoxamine 5'-phosphate oxidase family protein [Pseudomonadota bacterium]
MTHYTDAQRELQARFDSRKLADALEASIVLEALTPTHAAFIAERDFFFLSTVSEEGEPTVSHKGGGVGTVTVIDDKTLCFPAYDGNGMFLSLGNIAATGKIGMLFIDFETPDRVRVQAQARLIFEGPQIDAYPGAIAVVEASIDRVFINCARYIHKYQRVATSKHVPDDAGAQPLAAWKRIDGMQDVLPKRDQGRAAEEGGLISGHDYARLLADGES